TATTGHFEQKTTPGRNRSGVAASNDNRAAGGAQRTPCEELPRAPPALATTLVFLSVPRSLRKTEWLGREDSNLRMPESKSCYLCRHILSIGPFRSVRQPVIPGCSYGLIYVNEM